MKNWIRWTLLVQLLFFLGWAGYQESQKHTGPVVFLETLPVDPRDLWSGQYLLLRYQIGQIDDLPGFPIGQSTPQTQLFIFLKPDQPVTVANKTYTLWKAVKCQLAMPDNLFPSEGVWVIGNRISSNHTLFGIERYFFNQKDQSEIANIRSGKIYVEAEVGKSGKLILKNLVY